MDGRHCIRPGENICIPAVSSLTVGVTMTVADALTIVAALYITVMVIPALLWYLTGGK